MRLLVSVRSAAEADAALDGAAHIVDAKEPDRGPLGPVELAVLTAIRDRLPVSHPFSVALGDFRTAREVYTSISSLPRCQRPMFLKLGFAGVQTSTAVTDLVTTAREAASLAYESPQIIAVAYADAELVAGPDPWEVCEAARRGGAVGVVLDTACKESGTVIDVMTPGELGDWVALAHLHELMAGVAGSLQLQDFAVVAETGADIVGVRGAACEGGRTGTVSAERVAALVAAIQDDEIASSGETPELPFGRVLY